ncbi:hypothetical protein Ddc_17267 [Ditylenchus destructor]|nr:hypothetical protein Ddc_17267 [Ditylenchus destructor]
MSRYALSRSRSLSVSYSVDPDRCTVPLFASSRRMSSDNVARQSPNPLTGKGDGLYRAMSRTFSSTTLFLSNSYYTPYELSNFDAYRSEREVPLLYNTYLNYSSKYAGPFYSSYGYRRYEPGYYGINYGYSYGADYPYMAQNWPYYHRYSPWYKPYSGPVYAPWYAY